MAETEQPQLQSEKVLGMIKKSGQTPEVRQLFLAAGKFTDGKGLRDYIKSIPDLAPWSNQIIDTTDDLREVIDSVLVVLGDAKRVGGESALKIFLHHLLD
jgi:hypothetical protein